MPMDLHAELAICIIRCAESNGASLAQIQPQVADIWTPVGVKLAKLVNTDFYSVVIASVFLKFWSGYVTSIMDVEKFTVPLAQGRC